MSGANGLSGSAGIYMSCDVGQYLTGGDEPESEVERLVHLDKWTVPTAGRHRRGGRRSFMPRGARELEVRTSEGHELHLLAYRAGRIGLVAELHHGDVKLRSMHNHYGHRNPGSEVVMDNGHIHFPTERFPLIKSKSTYAYEVECPDDDILDFLDTFCALLNISIDVLQMTLEAGGRR